MKILIDIGHPAHVHLFKNFAWKFQKKGHEILFTCRDKEFERYLLEKYKFNYKSFGKKYNTQIGKILGLIKFDFHELLEGLKFKPDILLSHGSIYAAHASFLLGKPHISLEDTGNMEQIFLYRPFTYKIILPEIFQKSFGKKELRYKGIHELFYLHPNYFTPDKNVINELMVNYKEYILFRLISWNASHDLMHKSKSNIESIIEIISQISQKNIKVFISSEVKLPKELEKYKLNISPNRFHHVLAFAKLYIGEGGTTANEASLLGTPSVIINEQAKYIGVHQILQNLYQLQYYFDNIDQAKEKIFEIISNENIKNIWAKRKQKFLKENIDPTSFLENFIESLNKNEKKKI